MGEIDYPFSASHISAHNTTLARIITIQSIEDIKSESFQYLLNALYNDMLNHVEHYDVALFIYNKTIAGKLPEGAWSSLPS